MNVVNLRRQLPSAGELRPIQKRPVCRRADKFFAKASLIENSVAAECRGFSPLSDAMRDGRQLSRMTPVRAIVNRRLFIWMYCLLVAFMLLFASHAQGDTNPLGLPTDEAQSGASCLIPSAGAPSCQVGSAPGSSRYLSEVPYHVGNPIDVVSGNKYQYELDYQSSVSGLAFARHYNSSLSAYGIGFGPGWRHSYQVLLTRQGDKQLSIVQSDGRLLHFNQSSDPGQSTRFLAESSNDGYLEFGERSVWHLPDGRRLIFQGSKLVLIDFGNHRGVLTLKYRSGKLRTVSDSKGEVLTFNYVPEQPLLPEYGSQFPVQPAGGIASVTLPGGERIDYRYSRTGNLIRTQYPGDGDAVEYGYDNPDWPSHLTSRHSTADDRFSEWRYDEGGRGIVWKEGQSGLDIDRDDEALGSDVTDSATLATREGSSAVVTYSDGRQTQYRWALSANGVDAVTCDNCIPDESAIDDDKSDMRSDEVASFGSPEEGAQKSDPSSLGTENTQTAAASPLATSALAQRVPFVWGSLVRSAAQPQSQDGVSVYDGVYPYDGGEIPLRVSADRTGRIVDMTLGDVNFLTLGQRAITEPMEACSTEQSTENSSEYSHERLLALGRGEAACQQDWLLMFELMERLNSLTNPENSDFLEPEERGSKGEDPSQRGFWYWITGGGGRYCGLPAGKSCADMVHALEMAKLSRCAYDENRPCNSSMVLVRHHITTNTGFAASVYQDPVSGKYIVAFRGTDGRGDISANYSQSHGQQTDQYNEAKQLAESIVASLPQGTEIEFTGHSLGGGLATIAALATHHQATVFNTASFQPETAEAYGLASEYANASAYVDHYHIRSDPVTALQRPSLDPDVDGLIPAPGNTTVLSNPDKEWLEHSDRPIPPLAWHSIDAVVHVLEQIIHRNCYFR